MRKGWYLVQKGTRAWPGPGALRLCLSTGEALEGQGRDVTCKFKLGKENLPPCVWESGSQSTHMGHVAGPWGVRAPRELRLRLRRCGEGGFQASGTMEAEHVSLLSCDLGAWLPQRATAAVGWAQAQPVLRGHGFLERTPKRHNLTPHRALAQKKAELRSFPGRGLAGERAGRTVPRYALG